MNYGGINMKLLKIFVLLIYIYSVGCTLVDYKSETTEATPIPTQNSETSAEDIDARITQLEERVKALEEKLEANW